MGEREDIELLDSKVARLKVEYEQYFMKVAKREPAKLRNEVDRLVMQYSNRVITNTSLKFKLNSVVAKYNAYRQYWTRVLREIDDGTYIRRAEAGFGGGVGETGPGAAAPVARREAPAAGQSPGNGLDIDGMFKKYIDARKACNEPVEGLTKDKFKKTVEEQKKKVMEKYDIKDVSLKVYIKDGHARLAIGPREKGG
ncbi:MAG: MXAN_5187 C-terminal domain-containing protein [Deltaproteobacteria bacterium]